MENRSGAEDRGEIIRTGIETSEKQYSFFHTYIMWLCLLVTMQRRRGFPADS